MPSLIAPIEEARVLDLLVDAHAVEAERLRKLHFTPQRFGIGRGKQRIRPVILRQHEPQEDRNAVEDEAAVASLDPAQPEIALDPVDDGVPVRRPAR